MILLKIFDQIRTEFTHRHLKKTVKFKELVSFTQKPLQRPAAFHYSSIMQPPESDTPDPGGDDGLWDEERWANSLSIRLPPARTLFVGLSVVSEAHVSG